MLGAAYGRHDHARPLLEGAVDGFDAAGEPFEAAEACRELAVTLAALGRNDVAAGQPAEYVYEYLLVVAQKR